MTSDEATNTVAGAAITSPWWLPVLEQVSEIAALFLPIAGLAWLLIRVGFAALDRWKATRGR